MKNPKITFIEKLLIHVAHLIVGGATYRDVSDWHLMPVGKEMSRSKFVRYKINASKIIKDSDDK